MLSTIIINMIHESRIHLFPINRPVHYYIFSPKNILFFKTFNSEISYIEVRLTAQKWKPVEIKGKTNFTLVIK